MALVIDRPLDWAAGRSPDRIAAVGVLGIRPLLYIGEGVAPAPPAIEGLRIEAVGSAERPGFHAETGLYGFLRLPPGLRRIEITDAAWRVLPWAITASVPDRAPIRQALERGAPPPALPKPTLIDVPLRRGTTSALPPGLTAVWGVVREAGRAVALARIGCATAGGGTVVTYAERDGSFLLALPAEKPGSLATPPVFEFPRALVVHAPKPALAAALAGPSLVAAMPADLDTIDPNAPAAPFETRNFQLRPAAGPLLPGPHPDLPVRAAERSRWDIELLP